MNVSATVHHGAQQIKAGRLGEITVGDQEFNYVSCAPRKDRLLLSERVRSPVVGYPDRLAILDALSHDKERFGFTEVFKWLESRPAKDRHANAFNPSRLRDIYRNGIAQPKFGNRRMQRRDMACGVCDFVNHSARPSTPITKDTL